MINEMNWEIWSQPLDQIKEDMIGFDIIVAGQMKKKKETWPLWLCFCIYEPFSFKLKEIQISGPYK